MSKPLKWQIKLWGGPADGEVKLVTEPAVLLIRDGVTYEPKFKCRPHRTVWYAPDYMNTGEFLSHDGAHSEVQAPPDGGRGGPASGDGSDSSDGGEE